MLVLPPRGRPLSSRELSVKIVEISKGDLINSDLRILNFDAPSSTNSSDVQYRLSDETSVGFKGNLYFRPPERTKGSVEFIGVTETGSPIHAHGNAPIIYAAEIRNDRGDRMQAPNDRGDRIQSPNVRGYAEMLRGWGATWGQSLHRNPILHTS